MIEGTDVNFYKKIKEVKTSKILIDFHAPWCGPCRVMSSVLDGIFNENTPAFMDTTLIKVDIDQNPNLASEFNVMGIPHFALMVKDGNDLSVSDVKTGSMSKKAMEDWLSK